MTEPADVVVVSGHMVDRPDRPTPRFPEDQVSRVAREVEEAFDAWGVGPATTVISGGARGADLLAAESALRRRAHVELVLVLPPDQFRERSVDLPGTDWSARFEQVLRHSRTEILPDASVGDEDIYARVNGRIIERARSHASAPHALLIWDGGGGDGPGGTADFVRRLGHSRPGPTVRVIDPTPRAYARRESAPGPKKLLALDGGGVRGVLALEILSALENQLREQHGDRDFVLSDYFDYIGGTSTGAIIAAALALGMPVREVQERYATLAAGVFRKRLLPMRLRSLYLERPLARELVSLFGADATLGDPRFRSLLLVVLHNTVTDSPWPLSNCTRAVYNRADRYLNRESDRNLDLPLNTLVRGSAAAPVYFPPQRISVGAHEFVFQDGGMTPFNNPAMLLFLMATLPEYGLSWPAGEEDMLVASVGTGSAASVHPGLRARDVHLLFNASNSPGVFMRGASVGQDLLCRALGRTRFGAPIDREIGSRLDTVAPGGRNLFTYVRYDADLSGASLASLGISSAREQARLRKLDAVDSMDQLRVVGRSVAEHVDVKTQLAGFL
jgi:hypothetical protein